MIYPSNFKLICSLLHCVHDVTETDTDEPLPQTIVSLAVDDEFGHLIAIEKRLKSEKFVKDFVLN